MHLTLTMADKRQDTLLSFIKLLDYVWLNPLPAGVLAWQQAEVGGRLQQLPKREMPPE